MDSVNVFKGYDKVSQLESHRSRQRSSSAAITIAAVLLFTLVIGLALAPFMLEPIKKSSDNSGSSSLSSNSAESIRTICNVTRYPESCFTALSSSKKTDPEAIFNLSVQLAITHLSNLSSSLKSMNDLHSQPALKDCTTLLDNAMSQLIDSVSAMKKVGSRKELGLTKEKISDIQTWISAAMTDQETCNDGLEETGSTVAADKLKSEVQSCKESTSISLAIIANMQNLQQKLGLP